MRARSSEPIKSTSHRDLVVWQKAIELAVEVYRVSRSLPATERFGLIQQMRDASTGIAGTIAEGKGRNQPRDYARFLAMARGSVRELDTYFVLAVRLKFLSNEDLHVAECLLDEIGRMLTTLMRGLAPL